MIGRRKVLPRLTVLAAWVSGLVLETAIQVHVTGVRPWPDQRPQQVIVMMMVAGAGAVIVRWRDEAFRWTVAGAVSGLALAVGLALTGKSSPPYAGIIMLMSTWLGAVVDRRPR